MEKSTNNSLRSAARDAWGIIRLNTLYCWYCYIKRDLLAFQPILEQEKKDIGL